MKKFFYSIFAIALAMSLIGCDEDYNIVYHTDNEESFDSEVINKSTLKKLKLREPSKVGYTFGGWYLDSEFTQEYDPNKIDKENNEIFAKWIPNTYSIEIHNEDEKIEYNYKYGDVIDISPVEKYDYAFIGYYLDENLTIEFDLVNMPAYDFDLYPKFERLLHYYTVIYHSNNNQHFDCVTLEREELNTLNLPEPTREGYSFEGWFFDSEYENEFDISKLVEGNNELFAKWSINTYKVTILNEEEVIEYNFNFGEPIRLNPIEKYDYCFEGYYLDEELTQKFTLVNMPSNDIYLFPKFSKILHYYTFILRPDNGNYYNPITLERDDLDSLELPNVNKEGYTFDGWYFDNNYEQTFTIENAKEGNNELFAKWNVNSYKVVIHNEGENIEYRFDYEEPIRVNAVERYDYTFDGYFLDEELNNPFDYGTMPSHDIDLYPKFTKILHFYTFNYHGDNGVSYPSITLERDVLNTLELQVAIKEGYTFLGWYLDSELTNEFDISKALEGENELYAKWEVNTYSVTIHNNSEVYTTSFNYGEDINLPEIRNYEHSFIGYFLEEECVNKLALTKMPAYDLELFVKYCEHEWHKGTSCNYDIYCTKCGYRSLPIINIDTNEEITKDYVSTKVSVDAGSSYYNISNAKCKVKIRGNGTAEFNKKPYRLKFDQKQRMLGLNNNLEAKSWVLLAEWQGWFMKNFIAFDLAKQILNGQYYSSDYSFVILTINNKYEGMYLLAEQQQVDPGRVNVYEPPSGYEGTDIGYLLELDIYAEEEENYFNVDYRENIMSEDGVEISSDWMVPFYTIKNDIYCDAQKDFIRRVVQNSYDLILNSLYGDHSDLSISPYKKLDENNNLVDDPTIKTAKEAIEKVVDYESLLRMMIHSEICEDYDLGWSSFYISYDASKENPRLVFEAPWDFDLAFDIVGDTFDTHPYIFSSNTTWHQFYNMWFLVFANADWLKTDLYNKYEELDVHNIISNTIVDIENFVRTNMPYLYDNYCRWPEDCNFDLSDYDYFDYRLTESADWLIRILMAKRTNFENYLIQFKEETPFYINFVVDNGGSIMVYEGKDFSVDGIITNLYELQDISGGGQVNFKILI